MRLMEESPTLITDFCLSRQVGCDIHKACYRQTSGGTRSFYSCSEPRRKLCGSIGRNCLQRLWLSTRDDVSDTSNAEGWMLSSHRGNSALNLCCFCSQIFSLIVLNVFTPSDWQRVDGTGDRWVKGYWLQSVTGESICPFPMIHHWPESMRILSSPLAVWLL